jgi:hypothetical protein
MASIKYRLEQPKPLNDNFYNLSSTANRYNDTSVDPRQQQKNKNTSIKINNSTYQTTQPRATYPIVEQPTAREKKKTTLL